LELDPEDAPAYCGRAVAKKLKGDAEGALADCTRAIDVDPDNGWSFFTRGCLRYEMRQWPEALADFRQALGKDLGLTEYTQSRIYLVRSRMGEEAAARIALSDYRKARPRLKGDDWPDKVLGFLSGEIPEKEFLEAAPAGSAGKTCEATFYAGSRRQIQGDPAAAVALFKKCVMTGQKAYYEYRGSQAELDALRDGK
jgi:lipoprotein NlpI